MGLYLPRYHCLASISFSFPCWCLYGICSEWRSYANLQFNFISVWIYVSSDFANCMVLYIFLACSIWTLFPGSTANDKSFCNQFSQTICLFVDCWCHWIHVTRDISVENCLLTLKKNQTKKESEWEREWEREWESERASEREGISTNNTRISVVCI